MRNGVDVATLETAGRNGDAAGLRRSLGIPEDSPVIGGIPLVHREAALTLGGNGSCGARADSRRSFPWRGRRQRVELEA